MDIEDFNCLFCYCPLYGKNCGGNFVILDTGIKDCSNCIIPHRRDKYDYVISKL
jgi:Zn-finger protein